jgi:streptogramin lyase
LVIAGLIVMTAALCTAACASAARFEVGAGTTPSAIALGAEGDIWFAGSNISAGEPPLFSAVIGHVGPAGAVSEFELPTVAGERSPDVPSAAKAISAGPDGALWFAAEEKGVPVIGRATMDGTITLRALPRPNGAGSALAFTPDGELWFTEPTADRIATIGPSGEVGGQRLPAGSEPADLAAGPEGAIWFTERGTNRIGRITTAGLLGEFPLPAGTARPNQITLGPDGNLWFTETPALGAIASKAISADRVGRITTTGAVAMFRVAARPGGTGAIVSGPEGRLWFETGGEIAWIDTAGRTGPGSCDCGGEVDSLAVGSEGALWFASPHAPNRGGGGAGLISLRDPGFVGTYTPPPVTLGISVPSLRHGRTTILVACDSAEPCAGKLTMWSAFGETTPVIAQRLYWLGPREARRFSLRVNRTGVKLLAKYHGRLRAGVEATSDGHQEGVRVVVVRGLGR